MKLEDPSVTGVEAGGAPAVIRTKLSNASLVEVPSHVSRFGYDRGRLRPGIVHIGVGNFFRALVDEPLMTTEDKALLQSQDPLAVLKLSPFKALQLFADDVFIKAFLAAGKHLASRGPVDALRFAAEA